MNESRRIKSFERGLTAYQFVCDAKRPVAVHEVAKLLDVHTVSAKAYLDTLVLFQMLSKLSVYYVAAEKAKKWKKHIS